MRRRVNLRQIELFKAVIEHGTVSAAASALNVSQPAVSKSLAQLEAATELRLFERVKGRLAPTELGMRLYAEIDRIFSGVQQVENAIDALHRQARGSLRIGVMPALSGAFVQRAVTAFLRIHPGTNCRVESRSSEWIMESLVGRRLDVGLFSPRMRSPYLESELLITNAVVCIMPLGHPLAARRVIVPADLAAYPFVSFDPETATGQRILAVLEAHGVRPAIALVTNVALTLCEFVASGTGVSLVHPLEVNDFTRLVARPFEPATNLDFLLSYGRGNRNARLVDDFVRVARETAAEMVQAALAECATRPPPKPRRSPSAPAHRLS